MMVTELEDKVEILIRDFGLETILEQNDITPEQVLEVFITSGFIDLDDYFYVDTDEEIWKNED